MFLVGVLLLGIVAISVTTSLVLFGIAARRNVFTLQQSSGARELAQICLERALRSLRADSNYSGGETFTFASGTCSIRALGTVGSERILCTEGRSGGTVRRFEASIGVLFPEVSVSSWREVTTFTLCP